ncbi:MucBP domain-containing protein [Lactococcus garvieae]|uniref:MucBP domain-containing protein n=1 Tax=Lactococcus garvieae TaxID=1363 RepID=UPI00254D91ED|nr:MucBP domain-containing protein [Lactococcus garvieae]
MIKKTTTFLTLALLTSSAVVSPSVSAITLDEASKLENNSNSYSSQTPNVEVQNNDLNKESINSKGNTTSVPATASTEQISTEVEPKTENVDASSEQVSKVQNTTSEKLAKSAAQTDETIDSWMPDKVLQNWVAKELGKDVSSITQDDMKKIIYLQDTPDGLTSLKGLEYATSLQNLYLGYSNISDLSPISSLTSIVDLQVNDTMVTDLSPIYGLTGLKSLDISDLSIGDINMASLLQVRGSSLYQLVADNTGLKNIDYFSPYTNLTSLDLSYNEITDLRPLQNFTNTHGQIVGQTFPSASVTSNSRNVTFDDLEVYYMDGTRLEPTDISDGGIFNSTTNKISFSDLYELSGTVSWDYYTEPADPTTGIRFGGLVNNSYSLEIPAKVTASYVDTDGNKISDDVLKSGKVGDDYTTEQKDIDGYTFKEVQGSATGQFTDQAQTVTYVYTKNPMKAADVTVNYVDEDGEAIPNISSQTISGNVGDSYDATTDAYKLVIDGYTLDESKLPTNAKGTLSDQAQTITYVYTKNELPHVTGTVLVKYVDTNGNKISEDIVKSGTVGEGYSTEKKDIKGYTFKEVQGSATGQFKEQAQTVTYVYSKNKVNPVNPEPKPENKPSSSDKNNNHGIMSSTQHGLPATGENERITMMSIILGLILIALAAVVSIFRFKKANK